MEAESEGGGCNHGGGILLMMLTDSDNYCDKMEENPCENLCEKNFPKSTKTCQN